MAKVARRALRLTGAELDAFLLASRWGRLATANSRGEPHITPLGYVYLGGAIWFHALREGRRARDLAENARVAFLVDDGLEPEDTYDKRRGAILYGTCVAADDHPQLPAVRLAYMRAMEATSVEQIERRSHRWYRIGVERSSSWDFRKIPAGADRKIPRR